MAFDYDYRSNKKSSEDQCTIVNESFKSNRSFKKVTKRALKNQDVNREYERVVKRIREGIVPKDIGGRATDLGNGVQDVVRIGVRGKKNDMELLPQK